jgi:hypothetical protein
MTSALLSVLGLIGLGLFGALAALSRSERERGELSIRATNAALEAEARARAAAAAGDVVRQLRASGRL